MLPWQGAIFVGDVDEQGNQNLMAYTPTGSVLAGAFVGMANLTERLFLNNSRMERVMDPGSGDLGELRIWYADGACDIYATAITNSYGNLNRLALTRRLDRLGHGVTIEYASDPEYPEYAMIHRVLDADGHALTFYYSEEEGHTNRLERMVDWCQRTVWLAYSEDHPEMLVQIKDPEGLRSQINYVDGNGAPSALVTPYGRTEFEHAELRYEHQEYRCITVTRPTGAQERFYYEMAANGVWMNPIDPRNQGYTVPNFTPYDHLEAQCSDRNSYYWDAQNFASLSTTFKNDPGSGLFSADDAMRARGRHWLRDWLELGGTLVYPVLHAERAPSPDTAAQIRGQIIWYDYPGKPVDDNVNIGTFVAPAVIARMMPDNTSAWTWHEPNDLGHAQRRIEKWVAGGQDQYRTNTFVYADNGVDLVEHRFGPAGGDRRVVGYGYDPAHPRQPVLMTNAVGEVTAHSYDGLQRLATTLSPAGLLTTRQYGGDGYLQDVVESISGVPQRTNSYAFSQNRLAIHTDARFLTTSYEYDALGRLERRESGGADETWSFDLPWAYPNSTGDQQIFEPTAYYDRLGTNCTEIAWTADRRKYTVIDPKGAITKYTYCDCGAVESMTEGFGLGIAETTSYLYDQQGRLTQTIAPDGTTLTYGYDLPGRRTTVSDGFGTTTYGYDNLDRLVSAANAAGQAQAIVYDLDDHPISVTDANGVTVVSTYDEAGRLRTRSDLGGGVETWAYTVNVAGTTSYTNQVGNVTLYAYDAAGLRTNETQVGVFTNGFVYWPSGELRYLYDGKGNRTEWRYDLYGRVNEKQYQGQSTPDLLYCYDAAGRLTNRFTRTGTGANTNGYSTLYTYDGNGNPIVVTYPSGTASLTNTFDALNRLTATLDGLGTSVYSYAVLGNGLRTASENPPWSATDTVTVTNRLGRRAGLTIQQPSGQFVVTNRYDAAGRWAVVGGTAGTFSYSYPQSASVQPIGITLPGGGYITNWYDGAARLTRTELRTPAQALLNAHGYQYDLASQRTLVGRTNSASSLWNGYLLAGYDAAGQLGQAWAYRSNGTQVTSEKWSYGYDAAQNLSKRTNNTTVETFTVNALNQLQSIPNSTPTYDRRGNLSSRYFPSGPQYYWYYTYDHENQLTSVATDTSSTLATYRFRVDFIYDGHGRMRIKRDYIWMGTEWYPNSETRYLYDGMRIVQERDSGNVPLVTYTRGRDLSGSLEGAGGIGGLLARSHGYSGGAWSSHNFYHADGNGNVTALVNGSGTLQASYKYDPYGRYLAASGTLASANVMRFSSKPWVGFASSTTSGMYYYGYRFYDPYLQRWLNRDPLGEFGGINLYSFAANTALTSVDFDGRLSVPPWLKWGGGAIGALAGVIAAVDAAWHCDRNCTNWMNTTLATARREASIVAAGDSQHAQEGSRADSLVHCIAACRLARDPRNCRSPQRGLDFLQGREPARQTNARQMMDALNNIVGATLGTQGNDANDCMRDCVRALHDGGLWGWEPGGPPFLWPARKYFPDFDDDSR